MELLVGLFKNVGIVELLCFISAIIFFAARLEENSKTNKELLNTELKHVIHIMELNHKNISEDIARLEKKQEESNKIKERLTRQEVLVADIQTMFRAHLTEHHPEHD